MRRALIIILSFSLFPVSIFAHKDDYLNETFVFRTLDRHEAELEYWFDYQGPGDPAAGRTVHTGSVEYGITNFWMADVAVNVWSRSPGGYAVRRWRLETRRRFGEEGQRPVDIAASLEFEAEQEATWSYNLVPRVVLSKDLKQALNVTLNLFGEIGLDERHFAPGYNLGIRYPGEGVFRIGAEVIQTFESPSPVSLIPQLWILPWPEDVLKLGYARLLNQPERYFWRVAIEIGV